MQDDLPYIKQRILEDESIEIILTELGCEHVHREQNGTLVKAQLPERYMSSNKRAVEVRYNEQLSGKVRNRGIKGSIFDVVGYIQFDCVSFDEVANNIYKIKKWICDVLGYDLDTGEIKPRKHDYNRWLKKLRRQRTRNTEWEPNPPLPESIFDNYYYRLPMQLWEDEGMSLRTQWEFEVGYDPRSERIIFPIRDKDGRLIGVKGRYIGESEYIMEQRKYLYVVPCNKSVELFNLHRALPYILEKKEVIVFEAEKSTMFAWQYGYRNAVAIGGDGITTVQAKLLKDLGLDIKIVLAYDKDKEKKFILEQASNFKTRTVQYIYDKHDILLYKQSPVDRGQEVWDNLYKKHKITV